MIGLRHKQLSSAILTWCTYYEKSLSVIEFSQKEIDGIMSGNAETAFGY